eukprot:TRINITY_DN70660_c0_g1_i1.p1 TRINITY_DN70660_c0_g1~~TRINITY_DN70660_c0_g1_i1.p1  ORF type:complete len:334 (+),score=54.57 TRINITY_DN70660_c0_g1_i1:20-1021(+)
MMLKKFASAKPAFKPKSFKTSGMTSFQTKFQPKTSLTASKPSFDLSQSVRHGGSLREMKNRMRAVKELGKITKTMKMIASSRLKSAENRVRDSRPFAVGSDSIFSRASLPEMDKPHTAIIAITTDRGLCGGINSGVIRETKRLVREEKKKGAPVTVIGVGGKSMNMKSELGNYINFTITDAAKKPLNFQTLGAITDRVKEIDCDQILILYNHFTNVMSFDIKHKYIPSWKNMAPQLDSVFSEYEFEEDTRLQHFEDMWGFNLTGVLHNAYMENGASELGARVASMEGASKNAGELLKKLTITYNRRRQAAITNELIEIISGTAAIEEAAKAEE